MKFFIIPMRVMLIVRLWYCTLTPPRETVTVISGRGSRQPNGTPFLLNIEHLSDSSSDILFEAPLQTIAYYRMLKLAPIRGQAIVSNCIAQ